jgi:hypothetical protein
LRAWAGLIGSAIWLAENSSFLPYVLPQISTFEWPIHEST